MDDALPLSDVQLELMRVLWDRRRATVTEVRDELPRPLALTTIATMLSRMEKRGLVGHEVEGRQFLYFPLVTEEEARATDVSEVTRRWFQGDPKGLVSHLLGDEKIPAAELERLRRALLDAMQPKRRRRDGK